MCRGAYLNMSPSLVMAHNEGKTFSLITWEDAYSRWRDESLWRLSGLLTQPVRCANNATRLPFSGTPGWELPQCADCLPYVQGLYTLNPASHCTATTITWTIRTISGMNEAGCSWAPIDNNVRWLGLVKRRTQRSQALMPHARKRSLVGAQCIWSG